jgi:hypothetical protein
MLSALPPVPTSQLESSPDIRDLRGIVMPVDSFRAGEIKKENETWIPSQMTTSMSGVSGNGKKILKSTSKHHTYNRG